MNPDFDEALLEEMLRRIDSGKIYPSRTESAWDRFLADMDRRNAAEGRPVSERHAANFVDHKGGYLSDGDLRDVKIYFLTAHADVKDEWARGYHSYRVKQSERASNDRRPKKLAALVDGLAQDTSRSLRDRFNSLPTLAHLEDMTINESDDPDVMEWDDTERQVCGEINYRTFKRWIRNASN